jgi:subtilisin family serine protease
MPVTLRHVLVVLLAVVVGSPALPAAAAGPAVPVEQEPRPAVVLPDGDPRAEATALVRRPDGTLVVRRSGARPAAEARGLAERWRGGRDVVAADVAVPVQAFTGPAPDPLQTEQWALDAIRAPGAWELGDASEQVVAVVDSGTQLDHPDLEGALVAGRDLVDGDRVPQDENGHGTHVSGIAAAVAGNGQGVAGVALRGKVMPVRVLDAKGAGSSSAVAEGILWAVDNGATVVNLSLGGTKRDSVLAKAVDHALSRGVPVVAAAGNSALDGDPVTYPAALPGVIAVGAVDSNDQRPSFSSTGEHLALVAPGVGVLSTTLGSGYGSMSGTSMSAPHVAAAAALLRSAEPALTPAAVHDRLLRTARDLGPAGFDTSYGWGILDTVAMRTALTQSATSSPIATKHEALGGDRGLLGPATSAERAVVGGRMQTFERGSIWWSAETAAREVHGGILGTYTRLGAQAGALRFPSTDETGTPDGRGRFNHFQGGSIYWTLTTGAREVRGAIRGTWARLGWERSAVGYPVTDETGTPDGRGRFNHFQRGSIYWTPTTGAKEVRGAIRDHWASTGWERGWLGYPTSDEYAVPGGRANDFERGRVRWEASTGRISVVRW